MRSRSTVLRRRASLKALAILAWLATPPASALAQPTHVLSQVNIGKAAAGFAGALDPGDRFAFSSTVVGDLDKDGVEDLAIGAPFDDDGGEDRGAVWVVFMKDDGTVKAESKISDTQGGFAGVLDDDDRFGTGLAAIGDFDADGTLDLAVGAPGDDDHDPDVDPDDPKTVDDGAIWLLYLKPDGTVKGHAKISVAVGGFPNPTPNLFHSEAGSSLAALRSEAGSLQKLAVGAPGQDDAANDRGVVWVLTLNGTGTVKSAQKIGDASGGFPSGLLDLRDRFGTGVTWLGDVDGDGVADLAVGAPDDDDLSPARGAVWVLFMNADGTAKSYRKISGTQGGLVIDTPADWAFGWSLASPGDLDGNGVPDLFVGETHAWAAAPEGGAVRVLFLDSAGRVIDQRTIARASSGLDQTLSNEDAFGSTAASIGDLDGDGRDEIAIGAQDDSDGGARRGSVWILSLASDGSVTRYTKISDTKGGFHGILDDQDRFGKSVAALGDVDGDGVEDIAVGAPFDDDGGLDRGAVWVLLLNSDGTVRAHRKISQGKSGFNAALSDYEWFGYSLAPVGDLDHNGTVDLAAGAVNDTDGGGGNRGALWILFLNANGTVDKIQKISVLAGGFTGQVDLADDFGRSLAAIGDLDNDGVTELAVGANRDDDGGSDRGAVWVLFLKADGTVKKHQKISDTEGGFTGTIENDEAFGWAVAAPGDIDGDGTADLAVGVPYDNDGGTERGAAWALLLKPDGSVKSQQKISSTVGGLTAPLLDGDHFGYAMGSLVDLDANGKRELGVCRPGAEGIGLNRGAVAILSLSATGSVASEWTLGQTTPGFEGTIKPYDAFGSSLAVLEDLNGDGEHDLAVGVANDDAGGSVDTDIGTAWVLFLGQTTTTTTVATTTTTLLSDTCGDPNGDALITASDALVVLRAAVGAGTCRPCVCDADNSGSTTASDALRVLRTAVGQSVTLECPACT